MYIKHIYTYIYIYIYIVSKVKLYIAPVTPAPEGDGVFSGACWRKSVTRTG